MLRTVTLGEGKRAREAKEFAHGWCERDKLPTLKQVLTTYLFQKTFGMARGKESRDETWYSGEADNVPDKPGHYHLGENDYRNSWCSFYFFE